MVAWATRQRVGNGAAFAGFLLILAACCLAFFSPAHAATGINQQVNYQGRLLNSAGAVVPDGSYNMEFKIYQDGNGELGGGDETLKWTETRTDGNKVVVKNGYFSIQLGSVNAFGSSIDWNQDTLWLSTNIGGTGTPTWDGEMSPFRRMGSSAYSLNSNRLGGLTASEFLQLAPGSVQTDATTNNSIYVNKTNGTGNVLQLQKSGVNVLTVANNGNITVGTADSIGNLFVLDIKNDPGDPGGTEGAMYYNDSDNKFRCYQNTGWTDCIGTGGGGSSTLQQAYDAGSAGDQVIALDNTQDSIIFRNPSSSGTDSGYVVSIDQLNTGAVDGLRITSVGTGALLKITDGTATAADVLTIADGGVTTFKSQTNDANAFRVLNASNAEVFAVDTSAGQVRVNGGGIEFNETDSNPACGAGNYTIFADLSETKLKKCVNGVVSDVGAGDKYEVFTATGTYTKPSDATMIIVEAWGGGGGGGGGEGGTNAAVRSGGAGGGGGAFVTASFAAANIGSTVPVTVGAGGNAGAAGVGAAGTDGGAGGTTCFSTTTNCAGTIHLRAFGGGGGNGNGTAGNGGGGGGGAHSVGTTNGTAATGGTGGGPLGAAAGAVNSGSGGGGGATAAATGASGGAANFGGAGGGSSSSTGAGNSGAGGAAVRGGAAGGAGGSCAITTCTARNGGAGGLNPGTAGGGGTAGTGSGGAGGAGAAGIGYGGTGGGGGASNAAGAGGAGAAGGTQGGGGGGGGAAHTGSTSGGIGGAGGAGQVRIWSIRGNGADLAEIYGTKDTSIQPGDVVCLDPTLRAGVKKCEKAYDQNAFGIITTSPGLVIGGLEDADVIPTSVVLSGRTPVKVSNENGAIQAGDLLTPSTIPGVAMKATKAGQIIGQAMGPFDGEGIGTTMAFVKTNFGHGSSPAEQDAKSTLAYLLNEQTDFAVTTDLSNITTDRVVAGIEVITPKLTADKIFTNSIQAASGADIRLALNDEGRFILTNQSGSEVASFDSKGNVSLGLNLHVGGNMQIDGIMTLHNNAGGFAKIEAGQTSVRVSFSRAYPEVPVVTVSVKNGQFVQYAYTDLTTEGFTIVLSEPVQNRVEFSWSAISVKDAQTTSN